jgi:hypothetical protein
MIVTRYSSLNFVLIAGGTVLCPLLYLFFMMGWEGDQPGFQASCGRLFPLPELLSIPAFLIAYRWCGVSFVCLWVLASCGIVLALLSGKFGQDLAPIIVQAVVAWIATGISANSADQPASADESNSSK